MTELERLINRHVLELSNSEELSDLEVTRIRLAYRAGFIACRDLAVEELQFIGPHFMARDLQLGNFLERRMLAVFALGDTEVERFYGPEG